MILVSDYTIIEGNRALSQDILVQNLTHSLTLLMRYPVSHTLSS